MTKQWTLLLALISLTIAGLFAQDNDQRVLFTVEDQPVTVEEFDYIYSKTNGEQADYSEQSLQEYLDLYVKFKLKVQRAKDMRLDTIAALQDELAGYRRQLADSYLIDRAISDKLVEQAYDHLQKDVDFSHILVNLKNNASPADTLAAYERIMAAYNRIQQGDTFAQVAEDVSDDRYSKERGGRIGYTTALFPAGLHQLEYAAYAAPLKKTTRPIRTNAGYHLLYVHDRRDARGEIEVAHILIRKENHTAEAAKAKIDSIYQALEAGADFETLTRTLSEDKRTSGNNGYLGFFGISRYEQAFEDAAFGIAENGAYSEPVETTLGWHVIKRISRKEIQPFAAEKARLEGEVKKDPRFEEAKKALLQRIRQDNNFTENTTLLNNYIVSLPDTFTTFRWKAPEVASPEMLFALDGGYQATLGEFESFLEKATRQRVTYAREGDKESVVRRLYAQFLDEQLLKYEETQLEKRYPEFRSLMREYEEGILLFEATKMEVWDKAAQDSMGLEQFFTTVKGKYRWAPRAKTTIYRIGMNNQELAPEIREYAKTHDPDEVKAKFNTDGNIVVVAEAAIYEKGRNTELSDAAWAAGAVTELKENTNSRSLKFFKIEEIMPETDKSLSEARGYVIADYQDQLEKEWVAALRKDYELKINQKVFKSLIK